jgi:cephalosporin hydroxylase
VLDSLRSGGRIVSIDLDPAAQPQHERITYLNGSSVAPAILERVRSMVGGAGAVLVILDSDHHTPHVHAELAAYGDLVTPGSYLIAEDTNVARNPVHHRTIADGGPMAAVLGLPRRG